MRLVFGVSSAFCLLNRVFRKGSTVSLGYTSAQRLMSEFLPDSSKDSTLSALGRDTGVDGEVSDYLKESSSTLKRPENGLLIYWHPDCYEHDIPDHPEQPDRVKVILDKLKSVYTEEYFRESPSISDENILLFHTPRLLDIFTRISSHVEDAHANKAYGYKRIDDDTVVMWKTRDAAYRAAGAVIQAIDDIFSTDSVPGKIKLRIRFAGILPSNDDRRNWHVLHKYVLELNSLFRSKFKAHKFLNNHVRSNTYLCKTYQFLLSSLTAFCCVRPPGHHAERNRAMGFCYFNNVGIGAKYAQFKYGLTRVAVIDFDVHHGNGSEDGFKDVESLFFGSTHEKDNYPGTGQDPTPYIGDQVQNPVHRRIVNRYLSSGSKSRSDFKKKWQEVVDEMILFKPELIIISAGFDAHDQDPLSGTTLIEEDFEWATKIVLDASRKINKSNPPPVVSSLEGGYNLQYLASSAVAHVKVLASSNDSQADEDVDYGGNEAAALAAHIASLNLNK